jgi:hypothetical protein
MMSVEVANNGGSGFLRSAATEFFIDRFFRRSLTAARTSCRFVERLGEVGASQIGELPSSSVDAAGQTSARVN